MPKTLATESSGKTINPALLAFKPRQVLISRPAMAAKESNKVLSLKSEQKNLVLRSIGQYLERCGFSKCFKKLLSEAQIEKKELNSALPDLEEVYGVFLNKSDLEAVEVKDESSGDGEERKKKKKKKKMKVEVTKEEKVKETYGEVEDVVMKEKKTKKKKNKSKADEEKVSKKIKRSEPEEETKEDDEESKHRKKEEDDDMSVQETPVKEENGNVEKSETKSSNKKSNSKEPKKPFQRVNVEDVVFTDDRLKDNSYWAKGGAESGYGAKAQEVLGQVRGRGFRHEKTKKKRGSYRGGEIDLQTHSVKFEYSDEE